MQSMTAPKGEPDDSPPKKSFKFESHQHDKQNYPCNEIIYFYFLQPSESLTSCHEVQLHTD